MTDKRVKVTIIFRDSGQTGIETWVDYAWTKTLILTEEQSKLFFKENGQFSPEVICEVVDKNEL